MGSATSVNIGLIITACIFAVLVIIASYYFVVYFQHPQDRWQAWFPKVVVVCSLSLACFNIFLLPLQVANSSGITSTSGIDMAKLSLGFYGTTVCMVLVMIPFTVFYYEGEDSDDEEKAGGEAPRKGAAQFMYALKYIIPTLGLFAGVVVAMYYGGLAYATITTTYLQSPIWETTLLESTSLTSFFAFTFYCNSTAIGVPIQLTPKIPIISGGASPTFTPQVFGSSNSPNYGCESLQSTTGYSAICCSTSVVNSVVVSPLVFVVAVLTLLGWLIFSLFCGVGMAAMPYDMLNEFKERPRPITSQQYQSRKRQVGEQSGILMDEYKILNQELKLAARGNNFNRKYRTLKNRENTFRKNVMILEYHYKNLEDSYKFQGGNIILQYAKFIFACLSVIFTLLWIVHCCLWVIPETLKNEGQPITPIAPFLNNMLLLTESIPILGIVLYSMFVFYLLACTIKGNHKLGMRIVFIPIHPLIYGETLMNAMVFNAGVILLCSLPICQFSQTAFSLYAQTTPNQSIFGVQISSLTSFSWGFEVFMFVMLGMCVLTFFYQMYNPFRKQKEQMAFKWRDD